LGIFPIVKSEAFVLISVQIGKTVEVRDKLLEIDAVSEAHCVMGPYDVICRLKTDSADDIPRIVLNSIHPIEGVVDTMTATVFKP
jgi:DNA-binding Lrp family transcriptional regulator